MHVDEIFSIESFSVYLEERIFSHIVCFFRWFDEISVLEAEKKSPRKGVTSKRMVA